jgi:16S rRNA (cytosine967-C5)-methyltransferase
MTPAARTQAAIELLDEIIVAARDSGAAADTLVARYFANRRYAGSKDRRAVRELVYAAIRTIGERPRSGRAAMLALAAEDADLAATFDGVGHGPAKIGDSESKAFPGVAPNWLLERLRASGLDDAEFPALIDRAPLDVRVNHAKAGDVVIEGSEPITGLPDALRLPTGTDVDRMEGVPEGALEVQDAGSQIVTLAAKAKPGQRIVDLCAGAGGKTLALAAVMDGEGAILATDTDRNRLSRLAPRAERAGATTIETRLLNPGREVEMLEDWGGSADCVLIDAAACPVDRCGPRPAGRSAGLYRLFAARRGGGWTGRRLPRGSRGMACRAAQATRRARAWCRGPAHPCARCDRRVFCRTIDARVIPLCA